MNNFRIPFSIALAFILFCSLTINAQKAPTHFRQPNQKPKLVVGIMVDQMRYDYIYRFQQHFSPNGLKRFINNGFSYRNCKYNYVPTYTGPGHASVYTGTTPAVHGIVANDWWDRERKSAMYCSEDKSVKTVGSSSAAGQMSPKNLLSNTITDELRLASNFRSKVVGVALKDRGSILPAGHNPTGSYWFDGYTGNFITSTYYTEMLPEWVDKFNQQHLPQSYLKQPWELLNSPDVYKHYCSADNVPYENAFKGESTTAFPHDVPAIASNYNADLVRELPAGNTLTRLFAEAAIKGEQLGQGQETDFLALSFSSTDYIWHRFGPRSWELVDAYLRLDREVEMFFNFLDLTVGKGQYTVFLTADHGAVENFNYAKEQKLAGGFFNDVRADSTFRAFSEKQFGEDLVDSYTNSQIYLNHSKIAERTLDLKEVQQKFADLALGLPNVVNALTAAQVRAIDIDGGMESRLKRGYLNQRSGDVLLTLQVGYTETYYPKGTTHGVGYNYDTHVPCLWYGFAVPHGESITPVSITDIAPTLSIMLDLPFPNGCTGQPLPEICKK